MTCAPTDRPARSPILGRGRPRRVDLAWAVLFAVGVVLSGCTQSRPALPDQTPPSPPAAAVEAPEEHTVWVQITRKVGESGKNYTFGRMLASDLKRLTQLAQLPAVVCLHDCHWYGDHGVILLESDIDTGVYYLRIDQLIAIQESRPKDIAKLREEEREADRLKAEAERKENEKQEMATP